MPFEILHISEIDVYVVDWKSGGRRPATTVEVELWKRVQKLEKALEAGEIRQTGSDLEDEGE